jgi:hypothetical protein
MMPIPVITMTDPADHEGLICVIMMERNPHNLS